MQLRVEGMLARQVQMTHNELNLPVKVHSHAPVGLIDLMTQFFQ